MCSAKGCFTRSGQHQLLKFPSDEISRKIGSNLGRDLGKAIYLCAVRKTVYIIIKINKIDLNSLAATLL